MYIKYIDPNHLTVSIVGIRWSSSRCSFGVIETENDRQNGFRQAQPAFWLVHSTNCQVGSFPITGVFTSGVSSPPDLAGIVDQIDELCHIGIIGDQAG
jgi:hypothetical protein